VLSEPPQRELKHRPRPVEAAIFAAHLGDLLCRRHFAQARQLIARQAVNAGRDFSKLTRQDRPRLGKLLVAQDLARDGLALDALHDEAGAEIVLRFQHMHHLRRRQTGVMRELHQPRFGIEPRSTGRRGTIALRRAAQDRAMRAAGMDDVERPGLLAGAAGEFYRRRDAGRARIPADNAAREFFFDHLPLNFAGRFSRNAATPYLKSWVAPATRCDLNSRLS